MKRSRFFILILCITLLSGCALFGLGNTKKVKVDGVVIEYNKNIEAPNGIELVQRYHFIPRDMLLRTSPDVSAERLTFLKKAQAIYLIGYAKDQKWLAVANEKDSVMLGYIENNPAHYPVKYPVLNINDRKVHSKDNWPTRVPPGTVIVPPCINVVEISGEYYCDNPDTGTFGPCDITRVNRRCR